MTESKRQKQRGVYKRSRYAVEARQKRRVQARTESE